MNLPSDEFEKKLRQFLTGELPDDQFRDLEDFARGDHRAAEKLNRVKNLRMALDQSARKHRRITYPGNLAAEVRARAPAKFSGSVRRRRWAYALAASLVVIGSLVFLRYNRTGQNRASVVHPGLTIMADIQKGLNQFQIAHNRQLAGWSRRVTLVVPPPAGINTIGLQIPQRPTMGRQFETIKHKAEGAKL